MKVNLGINNFDLIRALRTQSTEDDGSNYQFRLDQLINEVELRLMSVGSPPDDKAGGIEVFGSGAHRSSTTAGATKPTDYSQLSHVALRLMAETQVEGNGKYGYGNWQKGIPVSNLMSHAIAHILAIINGDTSENHMGHALWNLEKAAHFIETRPDLIDIEPLKGTLAGK